MNEKKENKMIAYLSGGIEKAPKPGVWRDNVKEFIEKEIHGSVQCPVDAEIKTKLPDDFEQLRTENRKLYKDMFDRYIRGRDLRLLDASNSMIVKYDEYVGAGTHAEYEYAKGKGIPVYTVYFPPFNLTNLPGWVICCSDELFNSWDDLKEFLRSKYAKKDYQEK